MCEAVDERLSNSIDPSFAHTFESYFGDKLTLVQHAEAALGCGEKSAATVGPASAACQQKKAKTSVADEGG